jgi:hypothetical protein
MKNPLVLRRQSGATGFEFPAGDNGEWKELDAWLAAETHIAHNAREAVD